MPQPAFSVRPASCTLLRMSSIESPMVPDTVQLMVEVAGLCSSASALLVTRLAGLEFDVGQRAGDTLVRVVYGLVDGSAILGGQAVFLVPYVERRLLEGNGID